MAKKYKILWGNNNGMNMEMEDIYLFSIFFIEQEIDFDKEAYISDV